MKEVPQRFNELFSSDWNTGENSKLSSLERGRLHELYLEYLHWDMGNKVKELPESVEGGFTDFNEDEIQGFIQF